MTWEGLNVHLCTADDWDKFNKNLPGSVNGENSEQFEDTIQYHICLDEPEKIKFSNLDDDNLDYFQFFATRCVNYTEYGICKNTTEIDDFVRRSQINLVLNDQNFIPNNYNDDGPI